MPAEFDSCVRRGGKVRTKRLGKNKYIHICFIDGKSFSGEVKTKVAGGKDRRVVK